MTHKKYQMSRQQRNAQGNRQRSAGRVSGEAVWLSHCTCPYGYL